MDTQNNTKPSNPLMWIVGIAVTVLCAAGTAAIMGWIPTSMGSSAEKDGLAKLEQPQPAKPVAAKPHAPAETRAAPVRAAPVQVAAATPVKARCAECGVIESTREVDAKGTGSGVGAVAGGVAGALVGNQFGHGTGNTIMTVAGAAGGALAGNEIEKRVKTTKSYEVTVRMEDGSSRVIEEGATPTWHTGGHVKVVNGVISAN
jgi:outer membrane lipoprotein SlyB